MADLSYADFPAELLGAVEVYKNQTADLISGGIAGTVNLVTRKAFDSDESIFSVSAQANYGDYREETTPSFSALFSDSWETNKYGKFGILVAASSSEFKTRGDGFGLGNFHTRGKNPDFISYDEWEGEVVGLPAGGFSHPCFPGATDWRECSAEEFADGARIFTNEEAVEFAANQPFEGTPLDGQADDAAAYITPASYTLNTNENDRERTGITASLQWQSPDKRILATIEHINSEASLEYRERVVTNGDSGFQPYIPSATRWLDSSDPAYPTELDAYPRTFDSAGYLTSGIGIGTHAELPVQFRSRYNFNESTVEDTSLNIVFKATDLLTISVDYQRIDSEVIVHNNNITSRINGDSTGELAPFFLDLRGDAPTIEFLNPEVSNPTAAAPTLNAETGNLDYTHPTLRISNGLQQEEHNEASADSFKLDIEYALDGAFTAIKAGLYYSKKELTVRDTNFEGWTALGTPWQAEASYNASPQVVPELYERVDFSGHFNGETVNGNNNSFLFPRMDLAENFAQTLRDGCGTWSPLGNAEDGSGRCAVAYADHVGSDGSHFQPRHITSSESERTEFYIRGDFDIDLGSSDMILKGNIGLRYVDYQLQSTGGINLPQASVIGVDETKSLNQVITNDFPTVAALATGETFASTIDGVDYNTVLPSLNLSLGVTDDVIVRFGASKGLFYPSLKDSANKMNINLTYNQILRTPGEGRDDAAENPADWVNPVVGIENIEVSANARNAFLEPEESINLDLTTEWYFAEAGSLTLGLFHKKLSNIIRDKQFDTQVEVAGTSFPVSAFGPDNTGSGTIRGAELAYSQFYDMLPGLWSGLGMQFNFTYIDQDGLEDPNTNPADPIRFDSEGTRLSDNRNSFRQFTGLGLQGYSKENFNIVGMYEKNGFSARLAYTWRSDYLLTLRESEEFVPAFQKAQGLMDASIFYNFTDNIRVGVTASNLLDQDTETQYQQNQQGDRTNAFRFTTDRRYALIVRATF